MRLFGIDIQWAKDQLPPDEKPLARSFVAPDDEQASKEVSSGNLAAAFSWSLDLDKSLNNQASLINEYRKTALMPDVDMAIEDIITESIITDENSQPVKIIMDDVPVSASTKKVFEQEFDYILSLLKFPSRAHDVYKRFYIDGQLNYHKVLDETEVEAGIQELRFIDPRNLMKIREYKNKPGNDPDFQILKPEDYTEYWIYSENGFQNTSPVTTAGTGSLNGLKIGKDSIAHVNSGLVDPSSKLIMSHLHKAVRIARQLRMLKDSLVIYRVTHCNEKRVFFVGVNGLPKGRAEQHMQSIIAKYKNKLTYDANTGELRDQRKYISAIEDLFIPVADAEGKSTRVETLPGAQQLGIVDDVVMFQQDLYRSLNVPESRLNPETMYVLGRSNETTRDEVKYARFIARCRQRFSMLFDDLLSTQLILKNVVSKEEWESLRSFIKYDFLRDNFFSELAESEVLLNRMNLLGQVEIFNGKYFSTEWIKKNILRQDDDEIEEMADQMQIEAEAQMEAMQQQNDALMPPQDPNDPNAQGGGQGANGQSPQKQKSQTISIKPAKGGGKMPEIKIKSNMKEDMMTEETPDDGESLNELLKSLAEETKARAKERSQRKLKYLKGADADVDGSI